MHIEGFVDDKFNEGDLERLLSVLSANSPEQPSSAPSHISHGGLQALSHFNGMKIVEKNTAFALIETIDEVVNKKTDIIRFPGGIHVPGSNKCCTGSLSQFINMNQNDPLRMST